MSSTRGDGDRSLVLGLDPGTATLGYGLVAVEGERVTYVACGVIKTSSGDPIELRLRRLYSELKDLMERYRPSEVAVERLFFARNARTAIAVGQARGVALLAAAQAGAPVSEYTPLQIKQAVTSYGRADKVQIQEMVRVLLGLQERPEPDDAADALAVAICHVHCSRFASLARKVMAAAGRRPTAVSDVVKPRGSKRP